MRMKNYVEIDGEALGKALKVRGLKANNVSIELGYGVTYIANCKKRGVIGLPAVQMLEYKYLINCDEYLIKEEAQETAAPENDELMNALSGIAETLTVIKNLLEEICK